MRIRRIPADPGAPALGSIVENTQAAATSSNIPAGEDKSSTTRPAGRSMIYQIYGEVVTEEEWTQFHQNFTDQWKSKEKNEEQKKNEE